MESEGKGIYLAEIASKLTKLYSSIGEKRFELLKTTTLDKKNVLEKEIRDLSKEIKTLEELFTKQFGTDMDL